MKKFKTENIFNLRKPITHLIIIGFSLLIVLLTLFVDSHPFSFQRLLNNYIILIIQLELFLYLAFVIFKNISYGTTPGEITRILLSRFALFFVACFITAFIVFIAFIYISQSIQGIPLTGVMSRFFTYEFNGWFKTTLFGLLLGAVIFIVVLWQDALRSEQKLREENLIFQNDTLKNQINPHFLFNSLNTLSSLINTNPETAEKFIGNLASIYRYILEKSRKDKVSLQTELAFVKDYFELHKIRDEEKIVLNLNTPDAENFEILPVSLQILIENAIKHNIATREKPLIISITIDKGYVIVKNNIQKMVVLESTKTGLKNLAERIKLITGRDLIIIETVTDYIVKVPLI